ncbi:CBS domain-containing protein [Lignipirellula cremea]|uniref:Inosine 5'-monophosphate dehydrogenase n=1 Tax=Lignipirellula cremea TaxID=2528010 RepID=A0A518DVH7_9BACT|nr:CBS domain-containing protein [Lignipirellula cremea]QDU95846.1 inosine 5'-monophosphate dehydrogenase [Lignipirellula cremea]
MHDLQLNLLVTYNPFSIAPEAPVSEALAMFERMGFHHLPVVDRSGQLLGVLSDQDLFDNGRTAVGSVGNLVSREPITVDHSSTPLSALRKMLAHGVHSAPVVDNGQLVGLITSTDYLREFSYGSIAPGHERVSSFMTTPPDPIEISSSVEEALAAFDDGHHDYLPLVEGELTLAIISRRDAVKLARRRRTDPTLGLRNLFSKAPGVAPGERMSVAAAIMEQHHVLAIGVVNRMGRLLGIVTADTMLQAWFDQAVSVV